MFDTHDGIFLYDGRFLSTHAEGMCAGDNCSIHKPSVHALSTAPMNWRDDRGLMERICTHGIGHPDPDDIQFKRVRFGDSFAQTESVHGCDGCCG